ncbi:hypothetical protein Hanom_Chr04g00372771 [Helianthus anomalus]
MFILFKVDSVLDFSYCLQTLCNALANPADHFVLLTGIYVVSVNPTHVNVQLRNSWGDWGFKGTAWAGVTFSMRLIYQVVEEVDFF